MAPSSSSTLERYAKNAYCAWPSKVREWISGEPVSIPEDKAPEDRTERAIRSWGSNLALPIPHERRGTFGAHVLDADVAGKSMARVSWTAVASAVCISRADTCLLGLPGQGLGFKPRQRKECCNGAFLFSPPYRGAGLVTVVAYGSFRRWEAMSGKGKNEHQRHGGLSGGVAQEKGDYAPGATGRLGHGPGGPGDSSRTYTGRG